MTLPGSQISSEVTGNLTMTKKDKMLSDKFAKIEADIEKTGNMDPTEVIQAMYLAFFSDSSLNIREMKKTVDILEEKVIEQEKCIVALEDKVISLEVEQYENKITLKHIPTTKASDKETYIETKAMVEDMLTLSEQSLNSIAEFARIYPRKTRSLRGKSDAKTESNAKHPKIFIKFISQIELKKFIYKLTVIKLDPRFKDMIMENTCPPSLHKEWKAANKEAYRLRTEKKFGTRTVITRKGVILKCKTKKDGPFVQVDFPQDETEQ